MTYIYRFMKFLFQACVCVHVFMYVPSHDIRSFSSVGQCKERLRRYGHVTWFIVPLPIYIRAPV